MYIIQNESLELGCVELYFNNFRRDYSLIIIDCSHFIFMLIKKSISYGGF